MNLLQLYDFLYKHYFRLFFEMIAFFCPGEYLTLVNAGYAKLSDEGIYLEEFSQNPEVYRYQLYDHVVLRFGDVQSLKGKSLLETGCGFGGGLNFLCQKLNP